MGKSMNVRKATQTLACRAVLAHYLDGAQLDQCLMELQAAMRQGPSSWAFKPKDADVVVDDRTYYTTGGMSDGRNL